MAESVDELYTVKNAFWLGNYEVRGGGDACAPQSQGRPRGAPRCVLLQEAIGEARAVRVKSDVLKQERDAYLYRSHIGLGHYSTVLSEVKEDAPPTLAAVRLLATYLGKPASREVVLLTLEDWLADAAMAGNATVALVAGIIYMHEGQLTAALKAVRANATMEQCVRPRRIGRRIPLHHLGLRRMP
jgi:hypothetical protein